MAIAYSYPQSTPELTDTLIGIKYELNKDPAVKQFSINDIVNLVPVAYTVLPYKVYTALISQSGVYELLYKSSGSLTIGVTYKINISTGGADFTNVGAPDNMEGTLFVATASIPPTSYGTGSLTYNLAVPVVTVLENTIGHIWFEYNDVGDYKINSSNLFTIGKSWGICPANTGQGNTNVFGVNTKIDSINLATSDASDTLTDSLLSDTSIEIRVYN